MTDKSWILNPKAIHAAKFCIKIVEDELGVKLKLSHPNFLELLHEYCELTESVPLNKGFKYLINMAGDDVKKELTRKHSQVNIANLSSTSANVVTAFQMTHDEINAEDMEHDFGKSEEFVQYQGRKYLKFDGDKEFRGLYRGQPRYA